MDDSLLKAEGSTIAGLRVISSDDHVMEPPDLWTSAVGSKLRDRAPHVVRDERGNDWWYCDGIKGAGLGAGAQVGLRFEEPEKLNLADKEENTRPGAYIPEEHVKDMDLDGLDVSILYPSVALPLFGVPDSELLTWVFGTYNDWIADHCKAYPDRLKGVAMLNVDDVDESVTELERCAKLGLIGAMITSYPIERRPYDSPAYEPLWAAAEDLQIPLSLHMATNRPGPGQQGLAVTDVERPTQRYLELMCNLDHWVRASLANMIYSGVFERYPKLLVGSIEHELAWIPYFVDRLNYVYTQRALESEPYRYKEDALPSDYFYRNVFHSFQEDALGIRWRHIIGVDNLLWASDYPHFESTFPKSQQILGEILSTCTEEEKAKIVGANAARVYHLDIE